MIELQNKLGLAQEQAIRWNGIALACREILDADGANEFEGTPSAVDLGITP